MAPAHPPRRLVAAVLSLSALGVVAPVALTASPAQAADRPGSGSASAVRSYGFRLEAHTDFASATQVAPTVVRRNGTVTVRGVLLLSTWNQNGYQRFTRQPVAVQFAAPGSRRWFTLTTTTTDASGTASARIRVDGANARAGSYRLFYAGSATTASAASSPTRVDYR